jgi:hypothetical protein
MHLESTNRPKFFASTAGIDMRTVVIIIRGDASNKNIVIKKEYTSSQGWD